MLSYTTAPVALAARSSNKAWTAWNVVSLKASIMHKDITFKASQYNLDFGLAFGVSRREGIPEGFGNPLSGPAQLKAFH